ncbi:MAG: glycosyltransferase family 1 protein [Verrucomicrobia bacterium]|nr:glycosyltransferase family 1 protein [Verrucomicrobiota bacterium]
MTNSTKILLTELADYRNKIIDASMVGFSKRARTLRLKAAAIIMEKGFEKPPENQIELELLVSLKKNYSEALQQKKQEQAEEWLLAAYAASQILIYGPVVTNAAKQVIHQRIFLASTPIKNPQEQDALEQGVFHAENMIDYLLRAQEAEQMQNHFLLSSWNALAQGAEKISSLWLQTAKSVRSQKFFGLIALWRMEVVRHAENKNKKLLLRIASYFSTLLTQQEQDDSHIEKTFSSKTTQQISFCLPQECIPDAACKQAWKEGKLVPRIEFTIFYSWIYQSWQRLHEAGITCGLSTTLLKPGVIVTLGNYLITALGEDGRMPRETFLVDVAADRPPHPGAQLHVVENKMQARLLPHAIFIPHWPQRGLIPRSPSRGLRFENVVFFGEPKNLAPELRSEEWRQRLAEELGVSFYLQGNMGWHDYSQVDAVIAIRSFSPSRYLNKPATKLYNAWHAGVPFIGGSDSAYAADGRPGIDYLVATSREEVFSHLRELKENPALRSSLVQEGSRSAKNFTQEVILQHWKKLIQETIPKNIATWQKKTFLGRHVFFMRQYFFCLLCRYWK